MKKREAVVEVSHLTRRFGDFVAVDDLSFVIEPGEVLGLLGANGAGKTTTMQLMLGLTAPTSGGVTILGMSVATQRRAILQRVNFSSAYVTLPSNLSGMENLTVFAHLYGVPKAKNKILALAERYGVRDHLHKPTGALSAGQLTRLNLCKALLNDPEVLFLDEPTASLDPDVALTVREEIASLRSERGVTILYTSHNMREVEQVCDRVIFMAQGKRVASGTPAELVTRAQSGDLEALFIQIARGKHPSADPEVTP